jgi:hypothetical protein
LTDLLDRHAADKRSDLIIDHCCAATG